MIALCCLGVADDLSALKKEYAGYDKLMLTGGSKAILTAFDKISLPEFVYIDKSGAKTTKKAFMSQMTEQYKVITKFTKCVTKVESAKRVKGEVVARMSSSAVAVFSQGGQTQSIAMDSVSEDVWVVKGGKYFLKSSRAISEQVRPLK